MAVLRTILTVIFGLVCLAITVLILMQEGKQNGLGSLGGGSTETYWAKNKGRLTFKENAENFFHRRKAAKKVFCIFCDHKEKTGCCKYHILSDFGRFFQKEKVLREEIYVLQQPVLPLLSEKL